MKVMIVTTPIRPEPTSTPPIGSLSIVKHLRTNGIDDVEFYNIDANRPRYDDVLKHIEQVKPDVFGISAVVSTAYAYTKRLANDVKAMFPQALLVVGGNLAASAEILLRKTGADVCVVGEGEVTLTRLVRRWGETRNIRDFHDINGLVYLDEAGSLVNTGYPAALRKEEIYDFDWDDLEKSADIKTFFPSAFGDDGVPLEWFRQDPRTYEPHRRDKTVGILSCAKGCVARCTFCHRWDKGIRYIPVDLLMERLKEMVERYNVGFLLCGAETFGVDKRWLGEFCERIKELDILWLAPGVRANSLDQEWIATMKDAGCVRIVYGNETGSDDILKVMEKKVSLQDNYNSVKWAAEAGLHAPIQLVIGMPGESSRTIAETIEFCKFGTTVTPNQNPNDLSINYAQALPGTPLYEFARRKGMIPTGIDGEEAYLEAISDRDAHDEYTTLNFTDSPSLICRVWRPRITIETNYNFIKRFGLGHYYDVVQGRVHPDPAEAQGYFANPKRLLESEAPSDGEIPGLLSLLRSGKFGLAMVYHPVFFYRIRGLLPVLVLAKEARARGLKEALQSTFSALAKRVPLLPRYASLRKLVDKELDDPSGDDPAMVPLRKGR